MHGKGQRESELCRRLTCVQHMPVTTTTTVAVGDSSVVSTITADSFCKQDKVVARFKYRVRGHKRVSEILVSFLANSSSKDFLSMHLRTLGRA